MILAGVITVLWLLIRPELSWFWLPGTVLAVVLAAIFAPKTLFPVHWLLTKLGHAISRVTTPLILALLYFLIVTPLGIMLRLWGHDPMRKSMDNSAESYRQPSPKITRQDFDRPF